MWKQAINYRELKMILPNLGVRFPGNFLKTMIFFRSLHNKLLWKKVACIVICYSQANMLMD